MATTNKKVAKHKPMTRKTPKQIASYFPKQPYREQTHRVPPAYMLGYTPADTADLLVLAKAKKWSWVSYSVWGLNFMFWPRKTRRRKRNERI